MYTLHVKTDNTFDIYIDQTSVSTGNLLEDFSPPVNPEMEIDDPEDEQPDDWVTRVRTTSELESVCTVELYIFEEIKWLLCIVYM